jgi:hypothetical protein
MILAVDLAAKFSAACLMNAHGSVTTEWHSWGTSEASWVNSLVANSKFADVMLIEDLPFSLSISKTVRDVYRLQGRIIESMEEHMFHTRKMVFIPPKLWQDYFKPDGMKSGDKKAAKRIAEEKYGYISPELLHKGLHGVDRTHARKSMEDHVDAFLIARYMKEQSDIYGSIDQAVDSIPRLERLNA